MYHILNNLKKRWHSHTLTHTYTNAHTHTSSDTHTVFWPLSTSQCKEHCGGTYYPHAAASWRKNVLKHWRLINWPQLWASAGTLTHMNEVCDEKQKAFRWKLIYLVTLEAVMAHDIHMHISMCLWASHTHILLLMKQTDELFKANNPQIEDYTFLKCKVFNCKFTSIVLGEGVGFSEMDMSRP